jgi:hypothetical protein
MLVAVVEAGHQMVVLVALAVVVLVVFQQAETQELQTLVVAVVVLPNHLCTLEQELVVQEVLV